MKAKLKNANGFVRFLLNHGEKLGIVAVLAVAGLLIWKSLGRDTLPDDKQDDDLDKAVVAAKQNVDGMTWDKLPIEEQTDEKKFIARSGELVITPVKSDDFPIILPPVRPVIEPMKQRSDPVLLAVSDLETTAGSSLWMSADPEVIRKKMIERAQEAAREQQEAREEQEREREEGEDGDRRRRRGGRGGERDGGRDSGFYGGDSSISGIKTRDGALVIKPRGGADMQGFEDIRERSWVTVLAKVPIKQQFQMYEDALAGAAGFNATNDSPEYLGYWVERAEVTDKGQGKWVALHKGLPVKASELIRVMSTWPIQTPELVTPKYVHPLLTFPLPPMVMREWGDEITHTELPIQTPEEIAEEMTREMEERQAKPEAEEEDSDNPFASVIERRTQSMAYSGEGMYRGGEGGEGRYMGSPMGGRGGMYSGRGEGGEGGYGRMGGMGSAIEELPQYSWDGKTKFLLFRYFDSTVTPGHRYRYRVRLAFTDVNAQQTPRYLETEVTERLEKEKAGYAKANPGKPVRSNFYRMSQWSEPSPVAVVPQPGLAYIASAKQPSNPNGEPEARILVKSLDAAFAAEIALGDWFKRGSVLNSSQHAQIIWSSLFKTDPDEPMPESPVFDFITGTTLVDFDGGDQLTSKNRNLLAPARALVMDSSGRMRLRNELEDQKSVREYDLIIQESEAASRRERDRGDDRRGGRGEGGRGS